MLNSKLAMPKKERIQNIEIMFDLLEPNFVTLQAAEGPDSMNSFYDKYLQFPGVLNQRFRCLKQVK